MFSKLKNFEKSPTIIAVFAEYKAHKTIPYLSIEYDEVHVNPGFSLTEFKLFEKQRVPLASFCF